MITQRDIQLGRRIRKFRKQQGLTQEELATLVKVIPKTIQRLEAAKHRPSLGLLYKLASKLNVKTRDFF